MESSKLINKLTIGNSLRIGTSIVKVTHLELPDIIHTELPKEIDMFEEIEPIKIEHEIFDYLHELENYNKIFKK